MVKGPSSPFNTAAQLCVHRHRLCVRRHTGRLCGMERVPTAMGGFMLNPYLFFFKDNISFYFRKQIDFGTEGLSRVDGVGFPFWWERQRAEPPHGAPRFSVQSRGEYQGGAGRCSQPVAVRAEVTGQVGKGCPSQERVLRRLSGGICGELKALPMLRLIPEALWFLAVFGRNDLQVSGVFVCLCWFLKSCASLQCKKDSII